MDNRIFDEIRRSVDIVDIISNYVSLSRCGKSFKGLCPFHSDAHPSMFVSPEKQIYTCFSCGATGNVFTFVQNIEKISFIDAVKKVCLLAGIKVPTELETKTGPKQVSKFDNLYKLMEDLTNYYSYQLQTDLDSDANVYLKSRNLNDDDQKDFRIGYCPDSGLDSIDFLRNRGYQDDEIISCGIANEIGKGQLIDRLRGRIIFPICNNEGKVVAFSGRRIKDGLGEKYVNSPETAIFHKSNVLYNYHQAIINSRKDGYCYIVEGFMDAIAICKAGIKNVVATMGTAFTSEHISLLKQLRCELRLLFDSDSAGQNATNKCLDSLIGKGFKIQVVVPLTSSKDIDEFLQTKGSDETISRINVLETVSQYKISYLASQTNFMNHDESKKFVTESVDFLINLDLDDMDIDYYANEISKLSNITKTLILKEFKKKNKEINYEDNEPLPVKYENISKHLNRFEQADHQILKMMIENQVSIAEYRSLGISLTSKPCRLLANLIIDKNNKNEEISYSSLFNDASPEISKLLGMLNMEEFPPLSMSELAKIVGEDFLYKLDYDVLKEQLENEDDPVKQLEIANKITQLIQNKRKTN